MFDKEKFQRLQLEIEKCAARAFAATFRNYLVDPIDLSDKEIDDVDDVNVEDALEPWHPFLIGQISSTYIGFPYKLEDIYLFFAIQSK